MIGLIMCTKECNLRCRYCFEEENFKSIILPSRDRINQSFRAAMPMLKDFCRQLIEYNRSNGHPDIFTFHGGEPLLIYPKYLDEMCAFIKSQTDAVTFNVQTNGTLLTDEMIDVLKKWNFNVGISIDGCQRTHDENRVDCGERGTHDRVLKGVEKLRAAGISFGTMATITRSISQNPKEFYDFYAQNNLNLGFNACYTSPQSCNQNNRLDDKEYSQFLMRLFDLWSTDQEHSISIRPFERIIKNMTKPCGSMEVCTYVEDCRQVNIAIDTTGKIYHCLHYCNLDDGDIGDFAKESLAEIIEREMKKPSRWETLKQGKCGSCDIYNFCYGGCPYYRDAEALTGLDHDFNCASQKVIVHYIYDQLKKLQKPTC